MIEYPTGGESLSYGKCRRRQTMVHGVGKAVWIHRGSVALVGAIARGAAQVIAAAPRSMQLRPSTATNKHTTHGTH